MGWPKGKPRMSKSTEAVVDEILELAQELPPQQVAQVSAAPDDLSPQLVALIQAMNENARKNTLDAIAEMRKPDAETAQKQAEQKARLLNNALQVARETQAGEADLKMRQRSCSHSKQDGRTAFTGQINSDGCYKCFCPLCNYVSPSIRAEEWQRAEGLNLHKMRGLTIETLEAWAKRSGPPLAIPRVPVGMMVDLSGL